jgi:chaperonin GroEL
MVTVNLFGKEARAKMLAGVNILANSVKVTLGAKGKNVIIRDERTGTPRVTKDGVSVARMINLPDKFEDMGAQLVKGAAIRTAVMAGDGTTTSTILAQKIVTDGVELIDGGGVNPIFLKRGIDKAVAAVVAKLKEMSKPVTLDSNEELVNIATISANNDSDMGKIVAEALQKVGADGVVTIHDSKTPETYVEMIDGLQIDKGFIHPSFANKPAKMIAEYEDPIIILYERKISSFHEIELVLKFSLNNNNKPLLIIAEDIDGEALATLITNRHRANAPFVAIKLPSFGGMQKQMLEDLAVLTGGKVISPDRGETLRTIAADMSKYAGRCEKIIVSATTTNIIGYKGKAEKIKEHIDQVKALIEQVQDPITKEQLKRQRLAKLSDGVGCIFVGATTEIELKEKKDRIDDAVCATKAATEEGILPGGGVAYIRVVAVLDDLKGDNEDEQKGINLVKQALYEPLAQMAVNAGLDGNKIIAGLNAQSDLPVDYGYNFKTDKYENFFSTGIVDPAKVTRVALENGASVASMLLTAECAISDWPSVLPQPK